MIEDADFLEAILADPHDDGVRLAYADWLEERGNPRSEFIRVQFALRNLPVDDPRREELLARQAALLSEHERDWVDPLPNAAVQWEFDRGFVDAVELSAKHYTRFRSLRSMFPITHLALVGPFQFGKPSLHAIAAWPDLDRLRSFEIRDGYYAVRSKEVSALSDSPDLRQLRSLALHNNAIGVRGAESLAQSEHLSALTAVSLECYGFNQSDYVGFDGLQALLASRWFRQLTTLCLRRCLLDCACCEMLAESLPGSNIGALDLSYNGIGQSGAEALLRSAESSRLRRLVLEHNHIGRKAQKALKRQFGPLLQV